MNIKNISKETIEKMKEYDSLRQKMHKLFEELQNVLNDDYSLVENFTIVDKPYGVLQNNGYYIEETKCGEVSGWGCVYVPIEDEKFICISYYW